MTNTELAQQLALQYIARHNDTVTHEEYYRSYLESVSKFEELISNNKSSDFTFSFI